VRLAPAVAISHRIDTSLQAALIPQSPHQSDRSFTSRIDLQNLPLVCDFCNFCLVANTVSSQKNKPISREAQKLDSTIERRSLTLRSLSDRPARRLESPQRPASAAQHEKDNSAQRHHGTYWSRPAGEPPRVSIAPRGVLRFYKREGAALPLFGARRVSATRHAGGIGRME
jgi:hypothetical protein